MPPETGMPEDDQQVARLARQLLREGVALAGAIGLSGMHHTDRRALALLDELEATGRAYPSALADGLGLTRGSVTALVDRLCKAGLVERQQVPEDGRRVGLVLTTHARALGAKHLHPWLERIDRAVADLSPGEAQVVHDFLAAVLGSEADKFDTPGAP